MTPQQKRTLDFIRSHFSATGRGPTMRELLDALGGKSTSKIHRQLLSLTAYGFLRRTGEYSGKYVPVEADQLGLQRIPTAVLLAELQRRTEGGASK